MNDDIYIKDCGTYFTIINKNGEYKNHCHVYNFKSAIKLKKDIERKLVPRGKYFRSCVLRVTIDEKYIEKINIKISKDKNKSYYFNPAKGVINK